MNLEATNTTTPGAENAPAGKAPSKCGTTVLLAGGGVVAGGFLVALVIDHHVAILHAIFMALTFGKFWPGAAIHLGAAMLACYALCKLADGCSGRLFGWLLAAGIVVWLASLFAVTDLASHLSAVTVYQSTALWLMWGGALLAVIFTCIQLDVGG